MFSISATCTTGSPGTESPPPASHAPHAVPQLAPFIQAELRALLAAQGAAQVSPCTPHAPSCSFSGVPAVKQTERWWQIIT